MQSESRFIEVDGTRLHYLYWESDGPPLLIIHGNTHAGGVYEPLGDRLSSDFEVLALDLRGHGLSDKPDDYSWTAFRHNVTGLLDQLNLHDVVIVAHSRGGGVTLLSAAARPDRVRGVVAFEQTLPLSISRAMSSTETPEARAAAAIATAERRRTTFPSRDNVYNHFKGRGAFKDWQDEYLRAFVRHCVVDSEGGGVELASPTRVEALLYAAMVKMDAWEDMTACEVPLLTIFGEHGSRMGPGRDPIGAVKQFFPNTKAEVMPNASHSGPMEYPELFESLARGFIAAL